MRPNPQYLTDVVQQSRGTGRRDFLRQLSAAGLAAASFGGTGVSANELRRQGRACILLWMQGGPSQFETFSPKPHHANGGQTKAIATSVPGIHIAENLPHCAQVMNELAIIRSMTSSEDNHQRATYLLHHGRLPNRGVKFPTLGSNVAHQIGDTTNQRPNYVRLGGRLPNAGGGEFLDTKYGNSDFASNCLMARRLLEQGVPFVEVVSRGWDTHQDNFKRTRNRAAQIDQPMARLISDLKQRDMLDKTLVVWMGEFGRSPHVNRHGGRDHFPEAFNAVLAGGGIQGGQVLGKTNASGTSIEEQPVTVNDLFQTIYHTLGIHPHHLVNTGTPIKELLS